MHKLCVSFSYQVMYSSLSASSHVVYNVRLSLFSTLHSSRFSLLSLTNSFHLLLGMFILKWQHDFPDRIQNILTASLHFRACIRLPNNLHSFLSSSLLPFSYTRQDFALSSFRRKRRCKYRSFVARFNECLGFSTRNCLEPF